MGVVISGLNGIALYFPKFFKATSLSNYGPKRKKKDTHDSLHVKSRVCVPTVWRTKP